MRISIETCCRIHPTYGLATGVEGDLVGSIIVDVLDDVHLTKRSNQGSARLEAGPYGNT